MSSPLIIVGLGNPGPEYERTRHNAGFIALDALRLRFSASDFQTDPKFFAELSSTVQNGRKIILVKPTTYMNESGRTVRALLDFYKLTPADFVVLHDDLDIAPGTLRATESSRSAGNNGVESIIEHLGTQDFFRVRIGIGRPTETEGVCMPSHDYVLGRFSGEEFAMLEKLFPEIESIIKYRLGR
ncbi:MAG: aminoacyl-tRNA hydrolase [Undibacterium sp.]